MIYGVQYLGLNKNMLPNSIIEVSVVFFKNLAKPTEVYFLHQAMVDQTSRLSKQ